MDLHYEISTVLLLLGYALFLVGTCSHNWKTETGYHYGLWYRCDKRECIFDTVDYFGYVNFVRIGILISTLLFTISCICLLIEVAMVITRSNSRHKLRLGKTVIVTAILAEMISSVCLAFYGYRTVMSNPKLPALQWSFASTGCSVICYFGGTILRIMGPVSGWYKIPCLTNEKRRTRVKSNRKQDKRKIYTPKETNKGTKNDRNRPARLNITHPTDVVVYREASQPQNSKHGSCENLLVTSNRKDSSSSSPHHKYEEINLNRDFMLHAHRGSLSRDFLNAQRGSYHKVRSPSASSNQPSPRLLRDLSPRKSSSLPPGISPGFYAHVHRNPKHRRENEYEIATGAPSPFMRTSTLPFRPIQVLTIDSTSSLESDSPLPSPPPSPPLPPPPPPLSSATVETVNVRRMNSLENRNRNCYNSNNVIDYAPSPISMHSFGSRGY